MSKQKSTTSSSAPLSDEHALAISKIANLTTRDGFEFKVRRVEPFDEAPLAKFFDHVTPDDIRFRFLSPLRKVGHNMLKQLIDVDHDHKEDYLAFDKDENTIIASAEIAADDQNEIGEIAIVMHKDYKGKGMGWTLLEYVAQQAKLKGIKKLQSVESRENHQAIELEREMGFTATSYPGDATLVLLELDLV